MSTGLFEGAARAVAAFACLLIPSLAVAAAASTALPEALDALEQEIARLEQEYAARHAALDAEMGQRLSALEVRIAVLKRDPLQARAAAGDQTRASVANRAPQSALDVSGDFRLRYEHTSDHAGDPARDRGVLRARLGASYALNGRFIVGGRLTTGDPDDPNSVDVTMDEFTDDLDVSLDRAYVRYGFDDFQLVGGKFAKPFTSTELVWDGDVNPYGVAGRYTLYWGAKSAFRPQTTIRRRPCRYRDARPSRRVRALQSPWGRQQGHRACSLSRARGS